MNQKRRMGRPPTDPATHKLYAVGCKTTLENYAQLIFLARASGHSMARELEKLIERSRDEDRLEKMLRAILSEKAALTSCRKDTK